MRAPALLEEDTGRRLLLDYRCAVEYDGVSVLTPAPTPVAGRGSRRRESDIKCTRNRDVDRHSNALVHAMP